MSLKTIKRQFIFSKLSQSVPFLQMVIVILMYYEKCFQKDFQKQGYINHVIYQYGIEILSFDDNYIFGTFLKKDDSTNKFMKLTLVKMIHLKK